MEDRQFNVGRIDIAEAQNAAIRKRMIEESAETDPHLYRKYRDTARESEAITHFVRGGRYPLTATGKINTYAIFAETMSTVVSTVGTAGIITPTGLATDKTTSVFFSELLTSRRLYAFYDFSNAAKIFRDVDSRVRFAVTTMTGIQRKAKRTRFSFLTRHIADVGSRRFELSANEVLMMNPNTGNLPVFNSRVDADITLNIYRRHPVLIHDSDPDGNPSQLSFSQGLFNTFRLEPIRAGRGSR